MNDELKMKLESGEFSAMYELVADVLTKASGGKLDKCAEFQKLFSPYLLCRWLSMRDDLIEYADLLNTLNTNSRLTPQQFYKLAYKLVPKQRRDYIKYIKKPEKKSGKTDDPIINSYEEKSSIFDI